ncbi:hypothetical protein B0H11DRAFT_2261258 [Mycena galericulata]|nr:hypothetical protein B0H11DRAFT_2261258 [Mycena galericulata]
MAASQTTSQSERFCAPDADITVSSSDSVIFKLHRKNLELHSEIFANAANTTEPGSGDEVPQPDLRGVDFEVCTRLAEAAEKYLVYSAAPAAKLRLQASVVEHPLEVLDYAARHNHIELASEAARCSMGLPVVEAVRILSPDALAEWAKFYDEWHEASRGVIARYVNLTKNLPYGFSGPLVACVGDPNPCQNQKENMKSLAGQSPHDFDEFTQT